VARGHNGRRRAPFERGHGRGQSSARRARQSLKLRPGKSVRRQRGVRDVRRVWTVLRGPGRAAGVIYGRPHQLVALARPYPGFPNFNALLEVVFLNGIHPRSKAVLNSGKIFLQSPLDMNIVPCRHDFQAFYIIKGCRNNRFPLNQKYII
jgi:hypothetical protein